MNRIPELGPDVRLFDRGIQPERVWLSYPPICVFEVASEKCVELDGVVSLTKILALFILNWCGIED